MARKSKREFCQINLNGSAGAEVTVGLDDVVVGIFVGQCSREGNTSSATKGHFPFRNIRLNDLIIVDGAEHTDLLDRVTAEAMAHDEQAVKDGLGPVEE